MELARWNQPTEKKREIGKPKEKATKKESGPVTHSRVRDCLSLWSTVPQKEMSNSQE